ncbi:hypothetical protein ACVPOY_03345 [Staphylococcus aureus]
MAYQSEYALENEMMNQLEQLGYERVTIRDNKQLLDNFRTILNERHADKLEGNPLTDKEFQRLLTMIDGKSIFARVPVFYVINYHLDVMMSLRFICRF